MQHRPFIALTVKFLGICAFMLSTLSVHSPAQMQQIDWAKVHTTTIAAMDALYNLRFNEAEQKSNEVITMAPNDPRGHFFRTMVYYYRHRLAQNANSPTEDDFQKFMSYSQKTIQVCDQLLAANKNDGKALFYIGGMYGYRGMTMVNHNEMMKAVWQGKKGIDYLEDAVKLDPQNADAQMGFGLFNYLISQAPPMFKPAIRLAGLSGDKNVGLRQLEYAAANGIYSRPEAQFWLSEFYRSENLPERSEKHFKNFLAQYPQNTMMRYLYGRLLLNDMRRGNEAASQFKQASDETVLGAAGNAQLFVAASLVDLGNISMYKENYNEAISCFQKALAKRSDWTSINNGIALCYELQGNRTAAVPYYQKAKDNKFAQEHAIKALSEIEIGLVKSQHLFNIGEYTKQLVVVDETLKKSGITDDQRAELLYRSARAAHEKGDYAQAESRYQQALATKPQKETWIPPAAYYRLGLTQEKVGKKTEAQQNLEQALAFKDYENEKPMRKLMERDLARLKR